MDLIHERKGASTRIANSRREWRFLEKSLLVTSFILLLILQCNCQTILKNESQESLTKSDLFSIGNRVDSNHCHSCHTSNIESNRNSKTINDTSNKVDSEPTSFINELLDTVDFFTEEYFAKQNKTDKELQHEVEYLIDDALSKDKYVIVEGIEIKTIEKRKRSDEKNTRTENSRSEGRALFAKYTFEYRLFQKIKDFVDTHILSINLPKAARLMGFRSFGLKKFFVPLLIGAQVFKSILLAMFLPSILGSFGKILGKGISSLSAASSQASYPPANMDEQDAYSNQNKDIMGYESDPTGMYAYPQDGQSLYANMAEANDVNDVGNVDLSRFGANSQKMNYVPSKNSYYKNQMQAAASNSYKVFQKIPASSMILSNYDPFYSPLLSRLDGIFSRLGLAPVESTMSGEQQIGGQSLSDVKLEACREQLICLMYASPAKYAPYSNLVSAQLSRELNELRRPVSDNPEILRFFRYMRAARRGQESTDCMRAFPACSTVATPQHTMFAAFNDINKLVTARKLNN